MYRARQIGERWRERAQSIRALRERVGTADVLSDDHRLVRCAELETLEQIATTLEQCADELAHARERGEL